MSRDTLNDVIGSGPRSTWNMGIVKELRERAELPSDINLHNVNKLVKHVGAVMGQPSEGWDHWERDGAKGKETIAPLGAYMKILNDDGSTWCWYIRDPNGDASSIGFRKHAVTEYDDGTISVSPSIVTPHGKRWHGFLTRGVWKSC